MTSDILNPCCIERVDNVKTLKKFSNTLNQIKSFNIFSLESAFSEMANEGFVNEVLNYELNTLKKDELYFPVYSTYHFLNLLKSKYCDLAMSHSININYTTIKSHTAFSKDTMVLSLTKRPIKYSLYRQNNPYPINILDKNKTLELIHFNKDLNYGEVLKLRKHQDILVYNEDGNEDVLTLVLASTMEEGLVWEYDEKFTPMSLTSGSQESARLEHLCTMFGELGNENSLISLKKLINNQYFNVRWSAAKAIMLINTDEGIKALELLANDEHPEIRNTASMYLTQIKSSLNKN